MIVSCIICVVFIGILFFRALHGYRIAIAEIRANSTEA
jgi:hypothetical protein